VVKVTVLLTGIEVGCGESVRVTEVGAAAMGPPAPPQPIKPTHKIAGSQEAFEGRIAIAGTLDELQQTIHPSLYLRKPT